MKKASILIISIFCVVMLAKAQDVTETITRDFFVNFEKNPGLAYTNLFAGSVWLTPATIETNKTEFTRFLSEIGTYCGYELITTKKVGESYILKSFLIKYERQPLRFTFLLYKPRDKWFVQNFSWDSTLEDELYNAASVNK